MPSRSLSSFTPETRAASADAVDPDREVLRCLRRVVPDAAGPALAVCAGGLAGTEDAYVVHRLGDASMLEGGGRAPWLPFADAAFATVVLYRVTRHDVDIELLLGEAGRVLRPDGRLLLLEHDGDFAFAPLPAAGPAHLLQAWLRQAGFADIDVSRCDDAGLLAVART
jgi:SAM-dependent methyltransferase